MQRKFLLLVLILSIFLLVGRITATYREEAVPAGEMPEKVQTRTAPEKRKIDFYPPVPAKLPDLNKGYVFNEARSLADEQGAGEGPVEPAAEANLDEASYIGSVISGERRVGIIAYAEESTTQQPRAGVRGRAIAAQQVEEKHVQLVPGENFGGYTVAEVLPDKMVFEKDGLKVQKLLTEDKERKPPPQVQGTRRTQRPSSPARVTRSRRVEPTGRFSPGTGSESGRPTEPPQPPGTVNQHQPSRIIRGVVQPSG